MLNSPHYYWQIHRHVDKGATQISGNHFVENISKYQISNANCPSSPENLPAGQQEQGHGIVQHDEGICF